MIAFLRSVTLSVSVLLIAGCEQRHEPSYLIQPPLTAEQRATYRIADVDIKIRPQAKLLWNEGQTEVASRAGISFFGSGDYIETPDGKAAYHAYVKLFLEDALNGAFKTALSGERRAHLSVLVGSVVVTSLTQQALVGGNETRLATLVQLFDAETGEILTRPQVIGGWAIATPGLIGAASDATKAAPLVRALEHYKALFRRWIRTPGTFSLPFPGPDGISVPDLDGPDVENSEREQGVLKG